MRKWLVLACVAMGGCSGGGLDISGIYRTTAATEHTGSCIGNPSMLLNPAFVEVKTTELDGFQFFQVVSCSSATACGGGVALDMGVALSQSIENGYKGQFATATGDSTNCNMLFVEATATLISGVFRYESKTYRGNQQAGSCTIAEVRSRGTSLPCTNARTITGMVGP